MNKRIKKKHLRIDNLKVSPYRLRLLYKQITYSLEKLPSLSVLLELIRMISNVMCRLLDDIYDRKDNQSWQSKI